MYLKRLDAQGFKSFANKTTLEFAPGVTCVVGPNGTGKTNVADSLRWVLGEHASRTIRARKTEDVIFAGSDKRAPMGVAEVSITLDNSGHWLPLDFDEVVVTRRAYRSGDNEYLINNNKVRLRDVIELFQRAQVGQNSYAFMGQGMVEQVLSLRPEDRRALIEEAAEVRLYRHKLDDAQAKLKQTRENMDRVRMLVREIEPRITQLERQAGRAVKYHELARELAVTLHAWFSHQWRDVNEQVLAAITTHDQRVTDQDDAKAAAKACEDGLVQLRAAIEERRGEINVRDARLRSLEDYARDLERRMALDTERGKMLDERMRELEAELVALRADEAAQIAATPPTDTTEIEATLAAARAELQTHRDRLSAVEKDLLALQRSALAHEQTAARARAQADDLARRITDAADAAARLRREREAAAGDRAKALPELKAWAVRFAALIDELHVAGPRLDAAISDRARAVDAVTAARREQAGADAALRELRAKADALQVRLELMEQIESRPQAADAGVRAVLEAGGVIRRETVPDDIEIEGVRGVVGQLLRVPGGMERAIEAALAENLYAVVVDRQVDMRRAIDMLLGGDNGRATIYALDNISEQRPINLIKERGVVGVASSLVKCDGRYRKLIDTLLGRTVVVEDLAMAQRFVRRGLAHAVATVDGVLLRPIGSVAAGSVAAVEAQFAHERELAEIPEELETLLPQIAQREASLAQAVATIAAEEARAAELDRVIEAGRARRLTLDSALAEARAALPAFRARFGAIASDAAKRDAEIERMEARQQSLTAEREAAVHTAVAAEDNEQQERRSIAELETARAQLNTTIAEHASTVAHLDGEMRSVRQVTDGERAARERVTRQIEAKQEQQSKAQQEAEAIVARLESTQGELTAKRIETDAMRAELEPARQELAQFESRERSMSAELVEANARLRDAERALMEAENNVRIRRDELESLRESLQTEGFIATADGEIEKAPEPEAEPEDEPVEAYADASNGVPPTWMRSDDGDSELPPIRGGSTINPVELRDRIAELRGQIRGLGPVNEAAATDYEDSRERYDFLSGQLTDLQIAEEQLQGAIAELDTVIREKFRTTFKVVNQHFERYFSAFFRGGTARLELGETDEDGLPGIEIVAQPPGKKLGSLALLSGGERSLTAVALLFALLQANPSPICVLDEVDAALDEANVGRFVEELRELSQRTQFIIITHNRRTIETADTIYGVSMGADSVSRVLSLKLGEVKLDD